MRHQLSGRQLSRNASHRRALMRNMSVSLLRHERIRTTLPKAKELRRVVEPLITLAKNDGDANRRRAFARLRDAQIVEKLFAEIGPRFRTRPGGYTRILRMLPRPGDVIMPALSPMLGSVNFTDLAVQIATNAAGKPVMLRYGAFLQTIFEFLVIALSLFIVIKGINRLKRPAPNAPPPVSSKTEVLLQDIKDLLTRR